MSQPYFNQLNYSLGNEDTALELAILPERVGHVFSVAGSGGRVVPLLAKFPRKVTCIDVAQEQLYLAELRFAAVRALSHAEFVAFWGYPPFPATPSGRKEMFRKLTLSAPAKTFFEGYFAANSWASLLYDGKWENTFKKLSLMNRFLTGKRGAALFEAKTLDEQLEYLKTHFPIRAWNLVLRLLGNASVFNALLYKGHCAKKNFPESFPEFYMKSFDKLFHQAPARENYFLQLCFFGEVRFPEGNPVECNAAVFAKAKEALKETEVCYVKGDVIEAAAKVSTPIDFYSISDVPSYFSGLLEQRYLQALSPGLAKGAIVVNRYYLHIPVGKIVDGYEDITRLYSREIAAEKVGVYQVEVLRWTGKP